MLGLWFWLCCNTLYLLVFGGIFGRLSAGLSLKASHVRKPDYCYSSGNDQSSARHSHTQQDEFVYVLEGEFVLVTNAGRRTVGPGTCIGFPAGTGDGHHFLNETDRDAAFLVVGDRTPDDEVTYSDIDLELRAGPMAFARGATRTDHHTQ
jgi:mannose-6-phosphate isomerase-like protein (cupin superfamily)